MNNLAKLLDEFEIYWKKALNGDYHHAKELTALAILIERETKKPTFKKHHLNFLQEMMLNYALIIVNIPLR